jgi:AcrR family transcriptional regulator
MALRRRSLVWPAQDGSCGSFAAPRIETRANRRKRIAMAAQGVRRRKDDAGAEGDGQRRVSPAAPKKPGTRPASGAMSERRARILEIATRRFADFGFEATTVRQIAEDANILSGSLYHHFVTKDEMLHEIVRDAAMQMRDNALRIARAPVDAEHRLVALILLDLGEVTRNQKVHAILTNERRMFRENEEFAYISKAKRETYQAWHSVVQDGIDERLFKADVDIFLTILTVIRMLNTAADWYKNDDAYVTRKAGSYSLDEVIDFHLDFILGAVRLPSRTTEPVPRRACEELARFRS